jgi:hypothetical protein
MMAKRGRLLGAGLFFVLAVCAFLFVRLDMTVYITEQVSHYASDSDANDSGEDKSSIAKPPFFAVDHKSTHVELFSKMTKDGSWFQIEFGDRAAYNPNIIPHPDKSDTWFIVAQQDKSQDDDIVWFTELVCEATFKDDKMQCNRSPLILPIASTVSTQCDGDLEYIFNLTMGPHDARVFQGPDQPFIIYGSQSQYNCLGQWIHDFRRLVDWSPSPDTTTGKFFWPTDLQRPHGLPHFRVEKNWFPFWDSKGEMYLHYNIAPNRTFAKLDFDAEDKSKGLAGEDVAPLAMEHDKICMEKYMPPIHNSSLEYIHQATNSLAITLCKNSDSDCHKSDENTYIFIIFQFKSFYGHGVFEPYVMLFKQTTPFEIYGISSKPFWYHGRGEAGGPWTSGSDSDWIPKDSSQMVYTTSMNWKQQKLTYHGYLDDELFISFGVEDKRSFGIDVIAGDLIAGLELC